MKWLIVAGVGTIFALGALAAALGRIGGEPGTGPAPVQLRNTSPYRGSQPPAGFRLPDFALRDHAGDLVRSRELRGKVVLLTFLDSQCTESCPVIASQVARALEALAPAERGQVVALAISTDPAEDTATSVRAFLRRNRAVGKLRYVGGGEPVAKLKALWKRFNILSSLESGKDTLHSAPVRIYGRDGFWLSTLHAGADLTPANLAHDIRVALSA